MTAAYEVIGERLGQVHGARRRLSIPFVAKGPSFKEFVEVVALLVKRQGLLHLRLGEELGEALPREGVVVGYDGGDGPGDAADGAQLLEDGAQVVFDGLVEPRVEAGVRLAVLLVWGGRGADDGGGDGVVRRHGCRRRLALVVAVLVRDEEGGEVDEALEGVHVSVLVMLRLLRRSRRLLWSVGRSGGWPPILPALPHLVYL